MLADLEEDVVAVRGRHPALADGLVRVAVAYAYHRALLITGTTKFVLQRLQDARRIRHELDAQKQRWEREDQLRNYDERRDAYIELLRITDEYTLGRLQSSDRPNGDATEYIDSAGRVRGQLRMLAPAIVRGQGESVVQSYAQSVFAHLRATEVTEEEKIALAKLLVEEKKNALAKQRLLFIRIAQKDLGIWHEEDEVIWTKMYNKLFEESQKLQNS